MKFIKFLGHAAFRIKLDDINILIDPFLKNNPIAKYNIEDLKADFILITHGHQDHVGDAIEIAQKYNSKIIAIYELKLLLEKFYGINVIGMNKGGIFKYKNLKIHMLDAKHSSSFVYDGNIYYAGEPASFLIEYEGIKIFHAGDSMLIDDYKLYSNYHIDFALLPIGGYYTMDIDQMIEAAELLKPKKVIPMHYNTFDEIKVNEIEIELAKRILEKTDIKLIPLKPGEKIDII